MKSDCNGSRADVPGVVSESAVDISVKGQLKRCRAIELLGVPIVMSGRGISTGEIFDEYWIERARIPNPADLIAMLSKRPDRPDLFTFAQRVPDSDPRYNFRYEWDNCAILPIATYDHWLSKQVSSAVRRNVRAAHKRGVRVSVAEFDDRYVDGIRSIYDETPVRAGRRFWHYGKDLESVRKENGTYAERSTYLAAHVGEEMVGYLKVVWDRRTAAIMQVLSKVAHRDARPNNALIAEAVRQCELRGVEYLLYEKFDYGNKRGDSLTEFKRNNGFVRMDLPRYFVPLTASGKMALILGLHRPWLDRIPDAWLAPLRQLRGRWYQRSVTGA